MLYRSLVNFAVYTADIMEWTGLKINTLRDRSRGGAKRMRRNFPGDGPRPPKNFRSLKRVFFDRTLQKTKIRKKEYPRERSQLLVLLHNAARVAEVRERWKKDSTHHEPVRTTNNIK